MNAINDRQFGAQPVTTTSISAPPAFDFTRLFSTLWRGKYWLVIAAVVSALIGLYHAMAMSQDRYRATSVVVLDGGVDPVVQFSDFLPTMSGDQTIVNTELEVLRSSSLIQEIVEGLNLVEDPEFNPALRPAGLVDQSLAWIRAQLALPAPHPGSDLNGTINGLRNAVTVQNVPDSMVFEISVESTDPGKAAQLANAIADRYLERQLEAKFEATQQATAWLAQKVAELEVTLESSEANMNAFAAEMELISAETLEVLSAQLKDVRDRIAAREAGVARGEATARTASRIEQLRILEQELAEKISRQSQDLVALEQLQRESAADRQIYEYFLARLKESAVQEGIQQADARLLSSALVPDFPFAPQPVVNAVLSGFLGLCLMTGLLIAKEAQTANFRTADQLEEATGVPVLGQIPQIAARRRHGVLGYLTKWPNSAAAEAIRNLRTSLMMPGTGRPPQVIMSTSSLPGEGKTTQTLALAQNLAATHGRVLAIEGDVRKRVFTEYFGQQNKPGLMDVIHGKTSLSEAVWLDNAAGFDVLFGNSPGANAADIYSSVKFRRFLRQARKDYDIVLIDTPPVLLVPDARIISQQVDAVVYAVRWDKTREKQVLHGLRAFRDVGVEVTGTILTQVSSKGLRRYGYGKDYGTYGTGGYYQN